jgi:hypothetical protein
VNGIGDSSRSSSAIVTCAPPASPCRTLSNAETPPAGLVSPAEATWHAGPPLEFP